MSHPRVVEENVRPYIQTVYQDYLLLPDRELKVLLALKSFMWNHKENCYPSVESIGERCGKGANQVREILRILESKKLIRTERHEGAVSVYYITNLDLSTGKETPQRKSVALPNGNPLPSPTEIRCRSNIKNNKKETERAKSSPAGSASQDQKPKAQAGKAKPIPDDFQPCEEAIGICKREGLSPSNVILKFIAHARAHGWKRVDWQAALIKWILDERKRQSTSKPKQEGAYASVENQSTSYRPENYRRSYSS